MSKTGKNKLSAYQKRKQKKERNQRNLVEGKIGQAKNGYGLNKIRARRQDTSESWICVIFFVMNLVNLMKVARKYPKQSIFLATNQMINATKIFLPKLYLNQTEKFNPSPILAPVKISRT